MESELAKIALNNNVPPQFDLDGETFAKLIWDLRKDILPWRFFIGSKYLSQNELYASFEKKGFIKGKEEFGLIIEEIENSRTRINAKYNDNLSSGIASRNILSNEKGIIIYYQPTMCSAERTLTISPKMKKGEKKYLVSADLIIS